MTLFVCLNCPLTGTDIGGWDSDHHYFKNILKVHESHKGFQEELTEKKKLEKKKETDLINEDFFRMLHLVIYSYKGSAKCCLLKERLK